MLFDWKDVLILPARSLHGFIYIHCSFFKKQNSNRLSGTQLSIFYETKTYAGWIKHLIAFNFQKFNTDLKKGIKILVLHQLEPGKHLS